MLLQRTYRIELWFILVNPSRDILYKMSTAYICHFLCGGSSSSRQTRWKHRRETSMLHVTVYRGLLRILNHVGDEDVCWAARRFRLLFPWNHNNIRLGSVAPEKVAALRPWVKPHRGALSIHAYMIITRRRVSGFVRVNSWTAWAYCSPYHNPIDVCKCFKGMSKNVPWKSVARRETILC